MEDTTDFFDAEELDAIEDASSTLSERKQTQQEFLDALGESNQAETIRTPVELAEGVTATVEVELTGAFLDRLAELSNLVDGSDADDLAELPDVARNVANLLADVTVDTSLTSAFFYNRVYRDFPPGILLEMLESVMDAVQAKREQERGTADGFRAE